MRLGFSVVLWEAGETQEWLGQQHWPLSAPPDEFGIAASPDWVCEVPSPSTVRIDKVRKMPICAQYGVRCLWLVEPLATTLDVFKLESQRGSLLASFAENIKVRVEPFVEPFQEMEMELSNLWI